MANVVLVNDRNRWVYLNVEQVVRVYLYSDGLWAVETTEGGPVARHFLDNEQAGQVLTAMGYTQPPAG
ncbi:MAG: hypothetical protein HGB10_09670 [Coriobacteriia bacterium]|nr:hypothetical protein [Coriobacteriia bacterium]